MKPKPRRLARVGNKHKRQLGVSSLGDLIESKPSEFEKRGRCRLHHIWIEGADNMVCTKCGRVKPKEKGK